MVDNYFRWYFRLGNRLDITAKTKNFNMNLIIVLIGLTLTDCGFAYLHCKAPKLSQALAHTFGPFSHERLGTVTVSQSSSTA